MWDLWLLAKVLVMGVVEGLTEFLPISSTGHLILAEQALGFNYGNAIAFEVIVQLAAILAVIVEYKQRVIHTIVGLGRDPVANRFVLNVILAFLPLALLGLLFASAIKSYLFNPLTVALAFIVGGLFILAVESYVASKKYQVSYHEVDDMSWQLALKVGLLQALALIPGMSRSGATIVGGMWLGMSRVSATQFSFFLAMPTILAASLYELLDVWSTLTISDAPVFLVGSIASFVSAYLTVKWLLSFVSRYSLRVFGYYRIAFGLLILLVTQAGWVTWG